MWECWLQEVRECREGRDIRGLISEFRVITLAGRIAKVHFAVPQCYSNIIEKTL